MANEKYPTQERTVLLLADRIELGPDGKFNLTGLLVGNEIYLSSAAEHGNALPSLGVIYVLRDGEGTFEGRIQVEKPSGGLLIQENTLSASIIVKHQFHIKGTLFQPFQVPEFGYYNFRLVLGKHSYEFPIYIGTKEGHERSTAITH